jgi:ATP-binding cassette subfamily F protein 3
MSLLTAANLRVIYGTQIVLDGATAGIEAGEKVGLVGRNGCGKTTLMRCMQGVIEPDAGAVQLQRGAQVGYLSQDPSFDPEDTVRDAAEGAFERLHDLHRQQHRLFDEMAEAEGAALERLMRRQEALEAEIETEGGYAIDHLIDATLHGLGFTDAEFGLPVTALSGGQRNRLGLARLLLQAPALLLLDEPTNHLDLDGRRWLEGFLAEEFPGAVLVVSHDRWLLDRVVHRIIEVEQGVVRDYPGNYHKYVALRLERQLTQARVHQKQLDRIRSEESFIRRYKTGQRAKQARGRQARLDRFKRDELVDRPQELDVMKLSLPKAPRSGEQVLMAEGLSKSFDDKTLFTDFDLTVARGDRIGVIGPNGVGKTTLVRCLLGEMAPDAGSVRRGSRLSVGYYKQLHDHLDMSLTVWQYLQSVIVSLDGAARASEQQARDLAGAFLFSGHEQDKALCDLSGGERSRAVLAGLVAGAHNLLVLDEPSNHLDIPSSERLEQALSPEGGYAGSLLLITHDRALLEATCDSLIVFEGAGQVRTFPGAYSSWEARQTEAEQPRSARARQRKRDNAPAGGADPRPRSRGQGKAQVSIARLEERIMEIQQRIDEIDERLVDPSVYADGDQCRALQAERGTLSDELRPLEDEWAERAES